MPTKKPRVMVNLDEDTAELLKAIADATDMSESAIIAKLLSSHLVELWEYRTWLEQLPPGGKRHIGTSFLASYGPKDLLHDIKNIDPTYKFEYEKFHNSIYGGKDTNEEKSE